MYTITIPFILYLMYYPAPRLQKCPFLCAGIIERAPSECARSGLRDTHSSQTMGLCLVVASIIQCEERDIFATNQDFG